MRFAAFVVALLVFEVQSQQQCSESLGTCGGSRASLMQVKSFSQRLQTTTGRGASKHAETLAGFQKYTEELVDKYLQAPREEVNGTVASSGLGEEVIAAIRIIRDYLQSLYQDLLLFHDQDKKASAWCAGAGERCVAQNLDKLFGELGDLDEAVNSAQSAHEECQNALPEKCNPTTPPPVCPEYHGYRRTNPDALFPQCGKSGHLDNDFRTAPFVEIGANDNLGSFEDCLVEMNNEKWVDDLYEYYKNCDDQEEKETEEIQGCARQQRDFEDAFCQRTTIRTGHCQNYNNCMDRAEDHCVEGANKGEVGVCPQIEANYLARQADNETAERISCLLDVLVAPETFDKAAGLERCHQRDFSLVNAFWVIDCFIRDVDGPGGACLPEPEICTNPFKTTYYQKFGTEREEDEDVCCLNGSGRCYNQCQTCTQKDRFRTQKEVLADK